MTKEELIDKLKACQADGEWDAQMAHREADKLLLEYIADHDVWDAFTSIKRWYA